MKNLLRSIIVTVAFATISLMAVGQSRVGIGTTEPNPFAVLTLVSEDGNQGLLLPQLSNDQMLALADTLGTAEDGLIIYNVDRSEFFYWDNTLQLWHIGLGARPEDFIAGDGIDLTNGIVTNIGDLDSLNEIQQIRLIGDSLFLTMADSTNSVNLSKYLDDTDEQNLLEVLQQGANAGGIAISNLGEPLAPADAATKFYVDTQIVPDPDSDPENEIQDLQIANNILTITNNTAATPIDLSVYAETDTLPLSLILGAGNSANNLAITNLANPTNPQDAATRAFVLAQDTTFTLANILDQSTDANAEKITNLADPTDPQDAATKAYADSQDSTLTISKVLSLGDNANNESIYNLDSLAVGRTRAAMTAGFLVEFIGNTRIDGNLEVNGTISSPNALNVTSDERFKKDINPLQNALAKIMEIEGVSYYWRTNEFPDRNFNNDIQMGFIAQQLEQVYPQLVVTNEDGYKGVNYAQLTAALVEAMKEQQAQIQAQQQTIEALKAQLDGYEALKANVEWLMNKFQPRSGFQSTAPEKR